MHMPPAICAGSGVHGSVPTSAFYTHATPLSAQIVEWHGPGPTSAARGKRRREAKSTSSSAFLREHLRAIPEFGSEIRKKESSRPVSCPASIAFGPGSNPVARAAETNRISSTAPLLHRLRARPDDGGERRREANSLSSCALLRQSSCLKSAARDGLNQSLLSAVCRPAIASGPGSMSVARGAEKLPVEAQRNTPSSSASLGHRIWARPKEVFEPEMQREAKSLVPV